MQHVVSSFVRPAARPLVVLALAAALAAPAASASAAPGGGSLGPAGSPYGGVVRLSQTGPVVVFSETTTDLATGESVTDSSTEERDNQGRVVHAVDSTVLGDGTVEFSQDSTFTYGSGDRTEKIVRVFDGDGDGPEAPTVSVSTFIYDQRGNLVAVITTYDEGADGTIDGTDVERFTLDQRGRTLTLHFEASNGPGPDDDLVLDDTFTYDKRGNLTQVVEDRDFAATPQAPDERLTSTSTYDRKGNVISGQDTTYSLDADGNATLSERVTFSGTVDQHGNRLTDHTEYDLDGDGTVDIVRDGTQAYDAQGRPISGVTTTVEGGVTTVDTFAQTFDKRGNNTGFVQEESVDGVLQSRSVETDFFDQRGNLTGFVMSDDLDGDGAFDQVRRVSMTLDSRGRELGFVTTIEDGSGTVQLRRVGTLVYGKDTQTITVLIDEDNDGTFDTSVVTVRPL